MRVDFNGRNIQVRFSYWIGKKTGGRALAQNIKNKKIKTVCEIYEKLENGDVRVLALGESVRDPRDMFLKSVGRRNALSRATVQIPDRATRLKIWDEYYNQHRDGADLQIPDFELEDAPAEEV